jgi:hypothetical protein
MRKIFTLCMIIAVTVFFGTAIAQAEDLNIDFGSAYGLVDSSFAGAANQAGVWNSTNSSSGTFVDLSGGATDVSYSLSGYANANYSYGGSTPGYDDEDYLLNDYFYSYNNSWTLTLSGLDAGVYDITYYSGSLNNVPTGDLTINGIAAANVIGGFYDGTPLAEGTHWGVARQVAVGSDGLLTMTSGGTNTFEGLAGMQVAVAPEPVSSVLFVVGGTVLGFRKRFLKKKEVLAV